MTERMHVLVAFGGGEVVEGSAGQWLQSAVREPDPILRSTLLVWSGSYKKRRRDRNAVVERGVKLGGCSGGLPE